MQIWLDVYDATGNRLGDGPVFAVRDAEISRVLDGAGSWSATLPATDLRALTLLTNERRVRIWTDGVNGKRLLSEGIIRQRKISESSSGVNLTISGPDALDELKRRSVLLGRIYNQATVATVAAGLIALVPGWSVQVDSSISSAVIDARYDGVSVLRAFQDLATRYGYHLRLATNAVRTLEIGTFGEDSGLRINRVQTVTLETLLNDKLLIVEEISEDKNTEEIYNWLIPLGAGEGVAALTLEKSTRTSPYTIQTMTGPDGKTLYYISDASSVATYGEIRRVGQFKEVSALSNSDTDIENAANALYDAAVADLTRHKDTQQIYMVSVKNARQTIAPGQKVFIDYKAQVERDSEVYDYLNIRDDFFVLKAQEVAGSAGQSVALEISNIDRYPETVAETVISSIEQIELRGYKPAVVPAVSRYVYERAIAPGLPVVAPIEISDATLDVQRVRVRLVTGVFREALVASGVADDAQTPSGVTVWVNGSDETTALTGSASLAPSGGALNVLLDEAALTALIVGATGGLRQAHTLEVRCTGGRGRVELSIEIAETTQAIKL